MIEMNIFNIQRALTQKVSKLDLQFFFSADPLMVLHISVTLTKYIIKTVIFNVQRPITQNVIKPDMVLVFDMSSHVALHFCEASRKSLKPV